VQQVKNITSIIKVSPLDRFLGDSAEVINRELLSINRFINAEVIEVNFPQNLVPEEQGKLHLFPIDDNKYCLQLLYLQSTEQPFTVNVCSLQFLPGFFDQYAPETLMANQPFRFDQTTEQQFSICSQTKLLLEKLQQSFVTNSPFIQSLRQSEIVINILRHSLECITQSFSACQMPACRFLVYDSEREKVLEARRVVEQSIDQPLTIRELSRKVAMNECYLKKGFKALVGKTIHEYQQELRITKAKELLQQQGRSVSEVASTLGYSSISHFSTAFKKATGMKPCELLA